MIETAFPLLSRLSLKWILQENNSKRICLLQKVPVSSNKHRRKLNVNMDLCHCHYPLLKAVHIDGQHLQYRSKKVKNCIHRPEQ